MRKIKHIILSLLTILLLPAAAEAQDFRIVRGNCTPETGDPAATTRGAQRGLPSINTKWDASRIYRQLVILIEFRDLTFQGDDPRERYDRMLNEPGYNEGAGVGCIADYFREQSAGLFNLQFDVYGPYQVDTLAQPYKNPTENTHNYGVWAMQEATKKMVAEHPDMDFTPYDWNGDGFVEQTIYVCAGYSGNQGKKSYGYIWPNTSSMTTVQTPNNGPKLRNYTVSCELWLNNRSCGIGTICHEFTHSLGLPDTYNTSTGDPIVDEWDLMDGGNFTNYGWCPPNLTAMEKYLLGWLSPVELSEPVSITGMKSVDQGGEVYRISHSVSEFLLLENRQQRRWDFGAPGRGLVIYHVYYDKSAWSGNTVNNNANRLRFELVHADNLDYDAWYDLAVSRHVKYANSNWINNTMLSTSPYPWSTDSTEFVNDQLTVNSVPAPKMNYPNVDGEQLLNKPITNIRMSDDGLISFDFMGGIPDAIASRRQSHTPDVYYDIHGRRLAKAPVKGIYIVRRSDGTTRKLKL